jgi:hypothetical protein
MDIDPPAQQNTPELSFDASKDTREHQIHPTDPTKTARVSKSLSMATIRYRQNTIRSLTREDNSIATDHQEKAGILWNSFRDRLGFSSPIDSSFNFEDYIHPMADLGTLSDPFTREEIDNLISDLPTDKAPGPDGFTGLFVKNVGPLLDSTSTDFAMNFGQAR